MQHGNDENDFNILSHVWIYSTAHLIILALLMYRNN